jgi:transcriptional regulator with XRE-family HTH domain
MVDKVILEKSLKQTQKVQTKKSKVQTEVDPDTLGGRVRWMRKSKGWTQTDLATMCGVTYQNIQNCETNSIKMPRYINEIADALDTSIEYLVKGEKEPNVVRVNQHISLVSADMPIKPDSNTDYYVVGIKKKKKLFLPDDVKVVGRVNKVFVGHNN